MSWWPRQMPKTGLDVLEITEVRRLTRGAQISGSPGPLEMNRPS